MTLRHTPMTVDQLLNKILFGLVTLVLTAILGVSGWIATSIDQLNQNVAVVVTQVSQHKERLDTHDHKFERVFNFMYATHPKYRDTQED